jgi:hypothetical protein
MVEGDHNGENETAASRPPKPNYYMVKAIPTVFLSERCRHQSERYSRADETQHLGSAWRLVLGRGMKLPSLLGPSRVRQEKDCQYKNQDMPAFGRRKGSFHFAPPYYRLALTLKALEVRQVVKGVSVSCQEFVKFSAVHLIG